MLALGACDDDDGKVLGTDAGDTTPDATIGTDAGDTTPDATIDADAGTDPDGGDAEPTLVELLSAEGRFTKLLQAVTDAGLADVVAGLENATIFAPNDTAFTAFEASLNGATPTTEQLVAVLTYHVVPATDDRLTAIDAATATTLATETPGVTVETVATAANANAVIALSVEGEVLTLNETAGVVTADIEAGTNIVHEINAVLTPPTADQ